jgi:uroporphyrin-3 C-methyltransferase
MADKEDEDDIPPSQDLEQDEDNTPLTKRVVVTYSGIKRRTKEDDIPSEIIPESPTHIVSSPVDSENPPPLSIAQAETPEPLAQKPHLSASAHLTPLGSSVKPSEGSRVKSYRTEPSFGAPPNSPGQGDSSGTGQSPPPPPRRAGLAVNILTTLVLVALLGNAYYSGQQLNALQDQTNNDTSSVQALAAKTKKSLNDMDALQMQNAAQQHSIQTLKQELDQAQTRLVSLSGSKDWILSQAHYLVFMANERLQVAHDIPTAIAQLKEAKDRVAGLGDPNLREISAALAKDIAYLISLPQIDKQVVWDQVNKLMPSIEELKFKTVHAKSEKVRINRDPSLPAYKRALLNTWQELKGLVRVTRQDANSIPLALSLQEKSQILRTLQLMSAQLQWAVLNNNNPVYLDTLAELHSHIAHYFETDPTQLAVLASLSELQKQSVAQPTPSIAGSLQAVSQTLHARLDQGR